jgi:hypothetical protein
MDFKISFGDAEEEKKAQEVNSLTKKIYAVAEQTPIIGIFFRT